MRHIALAFAVLAGLGVSGSAAAWPAAKSPWVFDLPNGGTGCTSLVSVPDDTRYDVSFEGDIRAELDNFCSTCHISGMSGGMNLLAANAHDSLIGATESGAPSNGDPQRLRVRPGVPTDSILFLKLNCATPPFGNQMPIGGGDTVLLQKLVHDWIAAGALMPDSPGGDRTFVGNFETIRRPDPPAR